MEHTDQNQTPQASEMLFVTSRVEACKADDVSLMAQALAEATKPGSRMTVQTALQRGLRTALKRKAIKVLSYLLDNGADVSQVHPGWLFNEEEPFAKPSLESLEILIAHGWDIDSRQRPKDWPLLWGVVQYPDLVEWCLDHGASVYLPGDTPPIDDSGNTTLSRISLLESAAGEGSVPTFKLLREKGAPFHRCVLHAAVERAVVHAPRFNDSSSNRSVLFDERLAMIRYLVDEVGIDVKTEWWKLGRVGATPLEYVAHNSTSGKDVRELVWLLLDRGADPTHASIVKDGCKVNDGIIVYKGPDFSYPSPLEVAQGSNRTHIKEAIKEWQNRQRNNTV